MTKQADTAVKTRLKVNDTVVVIAGADRGKRGKILFVDKKSGRVIVEGINKRKKYVRATQENPNGGMITREFPIHISNVMMWDDKSKKGTRIGITLKGQDKVRVSRKSGKSLD